MEYNKVKIDGIDGYYSYDADGRIVDYFDMENNKITLNGSEEIIVVEPDYIPTI